MLPGPIENFECPKCKNIVSNETLISGNTCGAKVYSDGKQIAPMLPSFPSITKCSKCNNIFWLNSENITEKETPNGIDWAYFLPIDDLFAALEQSENKIKENELIIRRKIWWAFNDRLREGKELFSSDSEKILWRDNINKLIPLLDFNDFDEKVMLAELHRNIGDFEKCKDIIETISDKEYSWLIELFIDQIQKENTLLFELYSN